MCLDGFRLVSSNELVVADLLFHVSRNEDRVLTEVPNNATSWTRNQLLASACTMKNKAALTLLNEMTSPD